MADQTDEAMAVVQGMVKRIDSLYGECYFAPRAYPDEAKYPPPKEVLEEVLEHIADSELFLLYYPDKIPSGSLVELGVALALHKPIVILTRDLENLSYILREDSEIMTVIVHPELDQLTLEGLKALQRMST